MFDNLSLMTDYFKKPAKKGGRKAHENGGYRKRDCKCLVLYGLQRAP
ncbi:MAG: hypothetical protein ACUZ8H_09790 [Candidatus Anammoxibacter sp.]